MQAITEPQLVDGQARPGRPALRLLLCTIAATLLAWQIGARQLSQLMLRVSGAPAALRVHPASREAQAVLAAGRLADGEVVDSRRLAVGALRSGVLSPLALRSLLVAEQTAGAPPTDSRLEQAAAGLGWRDQPTQITLFATDIQAGRMARAADRLDAIGRTAEQPALIFPVIDSWLASAEFNREIAARLSRNPSWRGAYVTHVRQLNPAEFAARETLAVRLPHRDRAQARSELAPYVYWLLDHGEFARAHDLWRGRLASRAMAGSRLYDARFEAIGDDKALPFEWTVRAVQGGSAAAATENGVAGLRVETDGTAEGNIVEQRLVLPPGTYRFSVDMTSSSEGVRDAFQWTMSCGPARAPIFSRAVAAANDRAAPGSAPISFLFDVPGENCPMQFVDLALSRPTVPEAMAAFFTGARIQ